MKIMHRAKLYVVVNIDGQLCFMSDEDTGQWSGVCNQYIILDYII